MTITVSLLPIRLRTALGLFTARSIGLCTIQSTYHTSQYIYIIHGTSFNVIHCYQNAGFSNTKQSHTLDFNIAVSKTLMLITSIPEASMNVCYHSYIRSQAL